MRERANIRRVCVVVGRQQMSERELMKRIRELCAHQCWMFSVQCSMLEVESWLCSVRCWMLNVRSPRMRLMALRAARVLLKFLSLIIVTVRMSARLGQRTERCCSFWGCINELLQSCVKKGFGIKSVRRPTRFFGVQCRAQCSVPVLLRRLIPAHSFSFLLIPHSFLLLFLPLALCSCSSFTATLIY